MNREKKKIEALKDEFLKMEIPEELNQAIEKGLEKGRGRRKYAGSWGRWAVSVAAAMVLFVSGLNLSPSFAETMQGVPYLGRLVQVLVFVNNEASGGEMTDGLNVSEIQSDQDEWLIRFDKGDEQVDLAGSYQVRYTENPSVLTFQLSGVRMMGAKNDFQAMQESDLIQSVYPLMTLDDSTVRFQVVFSQPVSYQIEEYREPAGLRLSVQPLAFEEKRVFSLRSGSYMTGESFAQMEERIAFWCSENGVAAKYRLLMDSEGGMVIEFGTYESEQEAQADQAFWAQALGVEGVVEERDASGLPTAIPVSNGIKDLTEEKQQNPSTDAMYQAVQISEEASEEVFLQVEEEGLKVLGKDGSLIDQFSFDTFVFYKLHGEASFVLRIEGNEREYVFSGIYSDFMNQISAFTEVIE